MLPGMQALGVSTAEGVRNIELRKAETGKSVRPMEKKSSLFFFFFAMAGHVNRNQCLSKQKPIKCKDHVRCEKLEAFQHNMNFLKNFVFNVC